MVKRPHVREGAPNPATDGTFHHGRDEAAAWLRMLGLQEVGRWHVEVALQASAGSQFQLHVYAEEWGFSFSHARRSSWIRVTDVPFVHGRDDFALLRRLPALASVGTLVAELESEHAIKLLRSGVRVRSNVPNATAVVRRWLQRARSD